MTDEACRPTIWRWRWSGLRCGRGRRCLGCLRSITALLVLGLGVFGLQAQPLEVLGLRANRRRGLPDAGEGSAAPKPHRLREDAVRGLGLELHHVGVQPPLHERPGAFILGADQ